MHPQRYCTLKKLFRLSEEKNVVELNNLFPRSTKYHQHAVLDLETSEETWIVPYASLVKQWFLVGYVADMTCWTTYVFSKKKKKNPGL